MEKQSAEKKQNKKNQKRADAGSICKLISMFAQNNVHTQSK